MHTAGSALTVPSRPRRPEEDATLREFGEAEAAPDLEVTLLATGEHHWR